MQSQILKTAKSNYKSFKRNNPVKFSEQRDALLGTLIDIICKTEYPRFQLKLTIK